MNARDPHRQFDFWLGEWEVFRPDGSVAGTNRIEAALDGRVLREHYVSPSGYSGTSLNIYDASRQCWHQTWVDNEGLLLVLEGALARRPHGARRYDAERRAWMRSTSDQLDAAR